VLNEACHNVPYKNLMQDQHLLHKHWCY